jgi:hypothetical protein
MLFVHSAGKKYVMAGKFLCTTKKLSNCNANAIWYTKDWFFEAFLF